MKSMLSHIFVICAAFTLLGGSMSAEEQQMANSEVERGEMQAAAVAAQHWLDLVDKGNYAQSWDQASVLLKMTMPKDEWQAYIGGVRRVFGSERSRQLVNQRPAKDPQKLPKGSYMVLFYKSSFSSKPHVSELITMFLEDGEWRVMSYQAAADEKKS